MTVIAKFLRRDNVDFAAINQAALGYLPSLVRQWCPDGKRCGREYVGAKPDASRTFTPAASASI